MSINQSTNSDVVWAIVKCQRSFRCEAMKEEGDRGICSLLKGDEWLLLSWQIVRKAIEDVTTVIKEQLIDLWEVLRWIYHTHTQKCENEQEEHHPGSICKDVYKNKHYPLCIHTYIFCYFDFFFLTKVSRACVSQQERGSILDLEMRRWARKERKGHIADKETTNEKGM